MTRIIVVAAGNAERWQTVEALHAAGLDVHVAADAAEAVAVATALERAGDAAHNSQEMPAPIGHAIAHELNNIVGIVRGNVELATMDGSLPPAARTSLEEIAKGADQAQRLAQRVLAMCREAEATGSPQRRDANVLDANSDVARAGASPAAAPDIAQREELPREAAVSATRAFAGRAHVMIVDDDEPVVTLAVRSLAELGYRVSGYTDCEAAIAAIRSDPASFDIVVTDYRMPRMSGLSLAVRVREIRADLPVLVTSGYISGETRERARLAGVQHLAEKPRSPDELHELVQQVLASSRES